MTSRLMGSRLISLFDRSGCLAITSGLLVALSFPNAGLSFLVWISLIPLLMALEGTTLRTAFRVGITCGVTAYALLLYWINIVVTQYGHLPWAISIPIYLMLVFWLALFYGFTVMVSRMGELVGIKSAISLPIAWVAFDFIRSFLLTGFPWAMLGHSQYRTLPLFQIADIAGVYGITLLIVLANVVLYRITRAITGAKINYPIKSALVILILLVATLIYGFNRLNSREATKNKPLKVALIQGNIDQDVKWSPAFQEKTISIYEHLTREAAVNGVDLIIWPESAIPFFYQDEELHAARLKKLARDLSSYLLTGSPAHEMRNGRRTFLNSAFIISPNGETIGRSDKMHLVPFGEYVPLGRFFPFINKIVVGIGDFAPGEHATPLKTDKAMIGTLICFEAIFPEVAREYVNNGARILVNITNDAWFGKSSAPYQHLSIAAFRSVETRTPMLRAANTGITTIIDHNGHIRNMTELFKEDFRTGEVKPGTGDSIYLKIGDKPAWLAVLLTVTILLIAWIKLKKQIGPKIESDTSK